ncbi:Monothiol glutaredoxin-S7, chloroplastic [Hordeum vulgare]|nr:Monothiol glutaredoxin-S7, chloroplastic [Hordeum vulgare]
MSVSMQTNGLWIAIMVRPPAGQLHHSLVMALIGWWTRWSREVGVHVTGEVSATPVTTIPAITAIAVVIRIHVRESRIRWELLKVNCEDRGDSAEAREAMDRNDLRPHTRRLSETPHPSIHPSMGTPSSQSDGNGVDVNAMPGLEIGQSTIINMMSSMIPCASPPAVAQLGRALSGLGSLTLVLALTTVLHLPAAGPVFIHYKAVYYTILAFVLFIAVPVELATVFRLPCCSDDRRLIAFAKGLLPCAYVLLLVVISVGGFVPFKI